MCLRPFIQRAEYSGAKLNERCHCAPPFHLNDINRVTRDTRRGKKREGVKLDETNFRDEFSRRIGDRFENEVAERREILEIKSADKNLWQR